MSLQSEEWLKREYACKQIVTVAGLWVQQFRQYGAEAHWEEC